MKKGAKRGTLTIGVLVLLMASLMIAAVAVSLIISTASALRGKSANIGKQTQQEVTTGIRAMEMYATDGITNSYLNYFYYTLRLSAGSEPVKLENVVLYFGTDNNSNTYTYNGTINCSAALTGGDYANNATALSNSSFDNFYGVQTLLQSGDPISGYINTGDVVKACFKSPRNIYEDDKLKIKMIAEYGSPLNIEPTVYGPLNKERITIYPYMHFE